MRILGYAHIFCTEIILRFLFTPLYSSKSVNQNLTDSQHKYQCDKLPVSQHRVMASTRKVQLLPKIFNTEQSFKILSMIYVNNKATSKSNADSMRGPVEWFINDHS